MMVGMVRVGKKVVIVRVRWILKWIVVRWIRWIVR